MLKKVLATIIVFVILAVVIGIKLAPRGIKVAHQVSTFVFHRQELIKQTNGHTNVLILGIGGGTHDGPDLTDTIIFASIDWKDNRINLISIPRDLYIPDLGNKINTAYAFGEEKKKGEGLADTEKLISTVVGQPIHYGFRIDFNGFVKAVDELGGLDIDVDRTFDDYAYPITGQEDATCGHTDAEIQAYTASPSADVTDLNFFPCRYKHIHYDKGLQHMDGETALEYVRSRHALGPEGSDFARSRRQSKVITAFKEKVFSAGTILNPGKILNLLGILKDSIDTDIPTGDIELFIEQVQTLKSAKIHSGVLDIGDDQQGALLTNPPIGPEYNNAWVLLPKAGVNDYSQIQQYVSCELSHGDCTVTDNGSIQVSSNSATIKQKIP